MNYLEIVVKRKKLVIFSSLIIFLLIIGYSYTKAPIYSAEATVRIDKETGSSGTVETTRRVVSTVGSDPALGERNVPPTPDLIRGWGQTRGNIATEVETIKSYITVEEVAKRLGLVNKRMSPEEVRLEVLNLQQMLLVEQIDDTNMIQICATSKDNKLVDKVANGVAEVYKEQNFNTMVKYARSTRKFVENQLTKVEKDLKKAEEALKEYKEKESSMGPEPQTSLTLERVRQLEDKYINTKTEREAGEWQLSQLKEQLSSPEEATAFISADNIAIQKLSERLLELKIESSNLLKDYTNKHPEVVKLRKEIEKIEAQIKTEVKKGIRDKTSTFKSKVDELKEREDKLEESINKEIETLSNQDLQLVRLSRGVKLNEGLYSMLIRRHKEAEIVEAQEVGEVTIINPAIEAKSPISPKRKIWAIIGGVISIFSGLLLAFIAEIRAPSIESVESIADILRVPILGKIPYIPEEDRSNSPLRWQTRLITLYRQDSPAASAYRTLGANVEFMGKRGSGRTLLITSRAPGEGKSLTLCNLGISMAQEGKKTLLVSANLKAPIIDKMFGLKREPGLSDVLRGDVELKEAIRTSTDILMGTLGWEEILKIPGLENLNVLTSGRDVPNPFQLLNSSKMIKLIEEFKANFDLVLFDGTDMRTTTDGILLGSKLDGIVLVCQAKKVRRGAVARTKRYLENANTNLLGVVVNNVN